jgi:hypothetical protein
MQLCVLPLGLFAPRLEITNDTFDTQEYGPFGLGHWALVVLKTGPGSSLRIFSIPSVYQTTFLQAVVAYLNLVLGSINLESV